MTLDELRNGLDQVRTARVSTRDQIEQTYIQLSAGVGDPAQLQQQMAGLRADFLQLRAKEIDAFGRQFDPRQFVAQLNGAIPILLLPLRIQTRFQVTPNGRILLIRVYPDEISVQSHEPRLMTAERSAGALFWAAPEASDDPNVATRKAIWRGIAARWQLRRAAWIIRATNPDAPIGGDPVDQPVRIPAVWTLPERLVFRLYGPADRLLTDEILGEPIPDGLEMSLDPTQPGLGFNRQDGNLDYPPEVRWQVDFAEAVQAGMGVSIPLSQIGNPQRIERIVVLGVRVGTDENRSATLVEQLIEDHRYTDGFSIVPQGTPTNITNDADMPPPPDADATLAWLTGPGAFDDTPVTYDNECDGLRFAHALGINADVMRYIDRADCRDGIEAIAMKRALWAGTLGYYAQQMLAPMLDSQQPPFDPQQPEKLILAGRYHFTNFVFGRGPLPAFRAGAQPYGILPASADTLTHNANAPGVWGDTFLDSFTSLIHQKMAILAPTWINLSNQTARAGAGANANARLIDVLSLQASSVEWHAERFAGPDYLKNYTDFKNQGIGNNTPFNQYVAQLTARYSAASGDFPGLVPLIARIFMLSFYGGYWHQTVNALDQQIKSLDRGLSAILTGDVIDNKPYSEIRGIDAAYPNYIRWLAESPFDAVRRGIDRPDGNPIAALLYLALRHSLLYEHAFLAMRLFSRFQTNKATGRPFAWSDFAEKELYNTAFALDTTYWDYIEMPVDAGWPLGGPQPAPGSVLQLIQNRGALRDAIGLLNWSTTFGDIDETYRALQLFADPSFPTARLERLFAEHMDLCSYRLDAWAIGHVFQRLIGNRMPPQPPLDIPQPARLRYDLNLAPLRYTTGLFVGAYGWVEDVEPGPTPVPAGDLPPELAPQNGGPVTRDPANVGLIHAPSLNHAVTAAVLRSAAVTQPDTTAYNVDLSSARTRDALWVIEGVRNGQQPAALLGYRFERGLRDIDPTLQQYLPDLRAAFPMPKQPDADPGAAEAIPAHDVVNGLLLIQARRDGTLPAKVAFAGASSAVFIQLADAILDTFDACGDLMLSESVHQAAQGNYDRAGSIVTAAGEFTHIPANFEVAETPRSGTALAHRVLAAMNPPAADGAPSTPRARLEPGLNQWIGSLIGAPGGLSAKVTYEFEGGEDAFTVTFDQLGLEPIDLLYVTDQRVESDLNRRLDLVARPQFDAAHPDTAIDTIVVDLSGADEAITILDRLRQLLTTARPATFRDFVAPSTLHGLTQDQIDGIDEDELIWRVLGVSRGDPGARNPDSLWIAFETMLADLEAPGADPATVLPGAALFGVPEAVPRAQDLAAQLEAVQTVMTARHDVGLAKWTPFAPPAKDVLRVCRDVTEALLGGSFPLMPRITLPGTMAGAVLAAGPEQVSDWLFRTATVRAATNGLQNTRILCEELGHTLPDMAIFQWPADNKNWIAEPLPDGATLTGDPVSIALQPMGSFDPTQIATGLVIDEWNETIPNLEETTGITFHYDAPNAEPPQAVLLAVSQRLPNNNLRWTWDELTKCVDQALLLGKIRCVGPDEIRRTRLDPVLPATLAAETTFPATISTSWFVNTSSEVARVQQSFLKET
jgi:hypothetical protein